MRKNINKTDDPKNDDIKYVRLGDTIKLKIQIYLTNKSFKRIKYNENDLSEFVCKATNLYFDTLGKMQNKSKYVEWYKPL